MNAKTNENVRITLAMAYGGLELLARAAAGEGLADRLLLET
jgi:hypothetical protein